MEFVDTHCHIHFDYYDLEPDEVIKEANKDGVTRLLCVGCTLKDSKAGIDFVNNRVNAWATIGLHPHEGSVYADDKIALKDFAELASRPKVVAIGETGLDYYYNHSSRDTQIKLLEFQLNLAAEHKLPLIFHVRDAFDDFWPIIDNFKGLKGVVHSFSATTKELDNILERDLYIGLNGIMTFTKDDKQLEAAKAAPLSKILIETDAPFLTPVPFRGTICQPKHVRVVAEFLSDLRNESLEEFAKATTNSAVELFNLR